MFNDKAVFTASTGYVYKSEPGTPAISPKELAAFDSDTYGANVHQLDVLGNGTYTITVNGDTTDPIDSAAIAPVVQAALEKVEVVGSGNAVVTGSPSEGLNIALVGDLFGKDHEVTATGEAPLEEGESAEVEVTEVAKSNGWEPVGHTAAEELPEFGYEGGETEPRGTWQKKNLRNVSSEAPVDYVTIKAQQFDMDMLELYYGKNASKVKNVFGIDDPSASGVEKAFQIVLVDGDFKIAFSVAKSTVGRDESISLASDDFATLPLRSTFVKHPGRHLFEWTLPEDED